MCVVVVIPASPGTRVSNIPSHHRATFSMIYQTRQTHAGQLFMWTSPCLAKRVGMHLPHVLITSRPMNRPWVVRDLGARPRPLKYLPFFF